MTWVKITDALPDVCQQVLVARGDYVTATDLTMGWGKNENKVYWRGYAGLPVSHFSHWMPLPSAPRTAPNPKADVAPASGAHVQRVVGPDLGAK